MGKLIDLTGQKFGRLTVIERDGKTVRGEHARWLCQCECGKTTITLGRNLREGKTKSCGCIQAEHASRMGKTRKKHGQSRTRLHKVWCGMINRCYTPSAPYYKYYGGRGITVCEEWRKDFENFRNWALKSGYDPDAPHGKCTIDRIDVNGNYCPENCRWVDMKVQVANRRETKS